MLSDPEHYTSHRLPDLLPRRLSSGEAQLSSVRDSMALKGYCPVTLVRSGELVQGNKSLLASFGDETFCLASQEALDLFMLYPASYASRAELPARLTGSQRLGRPPLTLAGIAGAARERCVQQTKVNGPPADPLLAEEGLAELRDQLKDALSYIEVSDECNALRVLKSAERKWVYRDLHAAGASL